MRTTFAISVMCIFVATTGGCRKSEPEAVKVDMVTKYESLSKEACACTEPGCWESARARMQAELDVDRPSLPAGEAGERIKQALTRYHACGVKLPA